MKIAGNYEFAVPQDVLWKALLDPNVLSKTVPGFERLEAVGDNQFEGTLSIKVGPVQGQFEGKVSLSELNPPNGYQMKMSGKGAPGFVDGTGQIALSSSNAAGNGVTGLSYDFDLKIGGRIAGVGQRLLDSAAKVFSQQALENLNKQVEALNKGASQGAPVAEVAAPSQTEFAAQMAKGMAKELLPKKALMIGALVIAAVICAWLASRR